MESYLTLQEAAEMLGVSDSLFDRMVKAGIYRTQMVGNTVRVSRADVIGAVARRERRAADTAQPYRRVS